MPDVSVLAFRRRAGAAPPAPAVRAAANAAMDAFFAGTASLVTPERVAAVRSTFGDRSLDVAAAHAALFSDDEREDYDLAGFRDDVAAFRRAGRRPDAPMAAAEALAFLEYAQ